MSNEELVPLIRGKLKEFQELVNMLEDAEVEIIRHRHYMLGSIKDTNYFEVKIKSVKVYT